MTLAVLTVTVLLVGLAGCGGSSGDETSATTLPGDPASVVARYRVSLLEDLEAVSWACTVTSCRDTTAAARADLTGRELTDALLAIDDVDPELQPLVDDVTQKWVAFHRSYVALSECPGLAADLCPMEANDLSTSAVDFRGVLVALQSYL